MMDFPDMLAGFLEELIGDHGYQLPIYWAAISVNGSIFAGAYEQATVGLDCKVFAEHSPTGMFVAPVNIIFVDSRGEAARTVLEGPEASKPVLIH